MDSLDDDLDVAVLETVKSVAKAKSRQKQTQTPCHHKIDALALATYIYPTNLAIRDYQYNIVHRAFFHNIVVALPTGLGKTFIASTVMLNYLRWFPELKVIFMAPTKPLVAQQIKACCGITGIPPLHVAILLDKTRKNRAAIWDEKRVFFTTPQVVENDLAMGIVDPKSVVLLVIDEAHRAKGNYAYNNVVKFLDRFNKAYRILALTATPASDVEGVQEIVTNLLISKIEVRTEKSIDIFKYLKRKLVDRVTVSQSDEIKQAIDWICEAIKPTLEIANQRNIYEVKDPQYINAFSALTSQKKIIMNHLMPEGLKWSNYFILQLLVLVGQCLRKLNIYGIRSFFSYFKDKYTEFATKYNNKKSTNHMAAKFYFHSSIKKLLAFCEDAIKNPRYLGHPKLEIVISELTSFFETTSHKDSRVIIFTEFRELALDIVRAIEQQGSGLKPHIFIGQAKEKEKFDEEKYLTKQKKKRKRKNDDEDDDASTPASLSSKRPLSSSEQAQIQGMNQKTQKELIRKFKAGEYNVLVATSIGEEGLDIGEVDLIICYDSTSSPIKNIQRMGRTGRNRDGKVLLLFAGNEELKFDKAMGGYEYIQQHIMNGNMVELHQQNRIIPPQFDPVVKEQKIELPDENIQIQNEDDEDEIIKIAMKYMNKKTRAKKDKGKKIEKRFFMPDDAETGFQSVGDMLKNLDGARKRQKIEESEDDLIPDEILLRSDESSFQKLSLSPPVSKTPNLTKVSRQPTLITTPGKYTGTSLGVKKRTVNVINQLKAAQFASKLNLSQNDNNIDLDPAPDVDLAFDDDDDEILALVQRTSSMNNTQLLQNSDEKIFSNNFTSGEGLLTSEQNTELYMSYYTPVNFMDLQYIYDPQNEAASGSIQHSTTSKNYLRCVAFMSKLTDEESHRLIHNYKSTTPVKGELPDFVDFD